MPFLLADGRNDEAFIRHSEEVKTLEPLSSARESGDDGVPLEGIV